MRGAKLTLLSQELFSKLMDSSPLTNKVVKEVAEIRMTENIYRRKTNR